MHMPLKVQTVEAAGECQFHTIDINGKSTCYVKRVTTLSSALAVMDRESRNFNPLIWGEDCGGKLERCSFLPILFEEHGEPERESLCVSEVEKYVSGDQTMPVQEPNTLEPKEFAGKLSTRASRIIADFDPFATESEAEVESDVYASDSHLSKPAVSKRERVAEKQEGIGVPLPVASAADSRVQFKIFGPEKFKKPYQIWQTSADLMIIPANSVLSLPDQWLNKMSRGKIQKELDAILLAKKVRIGELYQTTNGGDYQDGAQTKRFLHAVLAAETWVANAHTITQMTPKCLFAADAMGAKTVVMTPFDCGTVDIDMAARAQLTAIRKFLYSNKIDSVERLYIVMSDALSHQAYQNAYQEIFYGVKNDSGK